MKIKIGGKYFIYFNGFAVVQKLDSVASTFTFVARFDPTDKESRIMFKPYSYPDVEVYTDEGKLLLTGSIVTHEFNSDAAPKLVKVSGYSAGGILEDCQIPLANYPLENLQGNLKDISNKLLKIFDLSLKIDASAAKECSLNYEKSVCEPTETIKEYLSKLASQRNVVMSHDINGNIIYFKPNINAKSKYYFTDENTVDMALTANGQGLHSSVSVIRQPSHGNSGVETKDTVNITLCKKHRTSVKKMSSGEDTNTARAVKSAMAAELKSLGVRVSLSEWLEDIKCGDIVDIHNHEIYLFYRVRFIVTEIEYQQNQQEKTMDITVMLPEAFTGDIPKNIFDYDDNVKSKELHH
ncbi:MAG: hypothetical protein V4547_16410 [Bacteroidota bacterium]